MKFKGIEKVWDLIVLNLLFVLFSIPIVTMGAAATAMHYALRRWREEQGDIPHDFVAAFRRNFKQATLMWMGFLILAAMLTLNFWIVDVWVGSVRDIFMTLLTVIGCVMLAWVGVVFPLLARFDNTTFQMAKNALLLALSSPVRTLGAMLLNILPVLFALLLPNLFLITSVLWLGFLCSASGLLVQLLFAPLLDRITKSEILQDGSNTCPADEE